MDRQKIEVRNRRCRCRSGTKKDSNKERKKEN